MNANASMIASWIRGREKLLLAIAALFQVGVLGAMTTITTVRHIGAEIHYLKTMPVDPRDMFRGEFVILNYEFTRALWDGKANAIPSDYSGPVYIPLRRDPHSKFSSAENATIVRPAKGPFLEGQAMHGGIRFGIEQYFVQEGMGHPYEDAARSGHLTAKVSVPSDGKAMVVGLEIEPAPMKR